MLVAYIACRCAVYSMRLKSDDYTCRTVRKRLMDAGSNPASSTNTLKANPNRLAFFCLLPRVCAGSCGFLRTAERTISASNRRVLLSVYVLSLRPFAPVAGRSPEGMPITPIKINDLRTDESISFFVALDSKRELKAHWVSFSMGSMISQMS